MLHRMEQTLETVIHRARRYGLKVTSGNRQTPPSHAMYSCHCWGFLGRSANDPAEHHAEWCPVYQRRSV